MYVFKYTVYPALSHECVIRPLIKRHQGYFMDKRHICPPGHGPRLSEVNLYTLLSLWMEIFPREKPKDGNHDQVISLINKPSALR